MITWAIVYLITHGAETPGMVLVFAMIMDFLSLMALAAAIGSRCKPDEPPPAPLPQFHPYTDTSVDDTHKRLMQRWAEDNAARNKEVGWP